MKLVQNEIQTQQTIVANIYQQMHLRVSMQCIFQVVYHIDSKIHWVNVHQKLTLTIYTSIIILDKQYGILG